MPEKKRSSRFTPHPAPGDLRLVQAFLNSRDPHAGTDELSDPQGFVGWLARWRLAPPDTVIDEATRRLACDIREGLRALLRAHNGVAIDDDAVARLNRALAESSVRLGFDRRTRIRLDSPEPGWPAALSRLLDAVVDAMATGRWQRFKACRDDACQVAFYDASRNRLGKWCTARRCGSRANSRAYRRRGPKWRRGAWL